MKIQGQNQVSRKSRKNLQLDTDVDVVIEEPLSAQTPINQK